VTNTVPSEPSGVGPNRQEPLSPQPIASATPDGQPATTMTVERPMPPRKSVGLEVDVGSARLHADVDRLTPLFLETLDDIERAGLAEHYKVPVRQAMRAYMTVMDGAWKALAEERLSEVTSGPGYQLEVTKLQQWLLERKQRSAEALTALQAKGEVAPRSPYSWRSRAKLYRQALTAWCGALDRQGDAFAAGQGLFQLHGFYGLTALRSFELWALMVLRWATVGVMALVVLAYLVGIPFMQSISPVTTVAVLGLVAMVGYYIVRLVWGASAPILVVIGYALAPRQQVTFTAEGVNVVPTAAQRRRMRRLLEIWCALVLGAAPLIWVLAVAGLGVLRNILATPGNIGSALLDFSSNLSVFLVLILPLAYLFFLPFVLYTQVLLSRDLSGHFDWEIPARRYPLRYSIILLPFEIVAVLAISIVLRQIFSLQNYMVLELASFHLTVSTVLYFLSFLLPYVFFIDLPYRYGVDHWRHKRLKELRAARRLAEEEIARLPLKGESKQDLQELEYHLGWLEYYRAAQEEVSETEEAPFSVERRTTAFLLATPLPLILAALQDIQSGETLSNDVVELLQRLISGGK
jgi:hypothetical protein